MNDGTVPRPIEAYCFNEVEVKVTVRELRMRDERVHIEPLIFDVLLYLIENRSRVVTVEELLEAVWQTTHVSETVLPRAIMKLRKALGDADRDGCIRTINKVGYRFTANVTERVKGIDMPRASDDQMPVRLALLPFDNETGDPSLIWIELGMPTLVANNLAVQPKLRVASIANTLIALHSVPSDATQAQRLEALNAALGANNALHASVLRTARGYQMNWRLTGPAARASGTVESEVVTDAALKMCPEIVEALLHQNKRTATGPFCLGDEFLNTAYARAMQALEEQRSPEAVRLLDLCMAIEDRPLEVDFQLLRALCAAADPRAVPFGEALLERTVGQGHKAMEARVSYAMSMYFQMADSLDRSQEFGDRAIALATETGDEETLIYARLTRSRAAHLQGDFSFARANARMALDMAEPLGDKRAEAAAHTMLGAVAGRQEEHEISMRHLRRAIELAESLNRPHTIARAQCELGQLLYHLGDVPGAIAAGERALLAAHTAGLRLVEIKMLGFISAWYSYAGAKRQMVDAYERMVPSILEHESGLMRGRLLHAKARVLLYSHQYVEVAEPLHEAYGLLEGRPDIWLPSLPVLDVALAVIQCDVSRAQEVVHQRFTDDAPALPVVLAGKGTVEAMIDHALGNSESALQKLKRYLHPGFWVYRMPTAALAAWLALEIGDAHECRRMVKVMGAFADESVIGCLVAARLAYEEKDYARAVERIAAADKSPEYPLDDYHHECGQLYRQALNTGTSKPLPRIRALPLLW